MKVMSHIDKLPSQLFCLFTAKLKQLPVIRLKFDAPPESQKSFVFLKKASGGQSSFGMPVLRPGIGEIQLDPVYLAFPEDVKDVFRIHSDK